MASIDRPTPSLRSPGDRGAAEPARFALLGLLLAAPAHGYDLARRFARGSALGDVLHLGASHLYALLTRLERDGLITGEQQDTQGRPQRRVYALTEEGTSTVLDWLQQPVSHPRDMRLDFPLKLYLCWVNGEPDAGALVARQRAVFEEYIARLEAEPSPPPANPDGDFLIAMRAGRIGRAQAALDWLDQYVAPLVASQPWQLRPSEPFATEHEAPG